jgi:DNA-binding MarR family transcriptional regulator
MQNTVDKVNHEPRDMADDVFECIHTVMHLFRGQQYKVLREGEHDLTHMENKALGFFAHRPGATQSDLVAHSGRDKAQLARLIKSLREKGLLEASTDGEDRRSVRLSLTPEGRAAQEAIHRQGRHVSEVAIRGLSKEQCASLIELLQLLKSNLQSEDAPARDHDRRAR